MDILNWFSAILLLCTSISLLISRDWRWSLGILAIQYLGVFWQVLLSWPVGMAAVKLITGWMVCAVLGIAEASLSRSNIVLAETSWPKGLAFRILIAGLVVLVAFASVSPLAEWLGIIGDQRAWGSIFLIGMGILHLGTSNQPLRVIIGLLTVLAGFEIIYSAVEPSILVAALLAIVNCGMALVGAHLVTHTEIESIS